MKSQDWIVKLYPDKDELAWALGFDGDFTLVDDLDAASPVEMDAYDWEFHQHGMRFLDNEGPRLDLVMLDNGYPREDENGPNWNLGTAGSSSSRSIRIRCALPCRTRTGSASGPTRCSARRAGTHCSSPTDSAWSA
jgi:hypothetical protein